MLKEKKNRNVYRSANKFQQQPSIANLVTTDTMLNRIKFTSC